jgi:hypothetical protein
MQLRDAMRAGWLTDLSGMHSADQFKSIFARDITDIRCACAIEREADKNREFSLMQYPNDTTRRDPESSVLLEMVAIILLAALAQEVNTEGAAQQRSTSRASRS